MYQEFETKLSQVIGKSQIKKGEPLSKHTTFKIGGPADYFISPEKEESLSELIKVCNEYEIPFYVIGNGSNLLVGDNGFRGVIIEMQNQFSKIQIEPWEGATKRITAGAGIMLSKLSGEAARNALTGLEFAAGIPGTLGGAVAMNAGAYDGEIKDCIVSAKVMTRQGEILVLTREQLELSYRKSIIQKEGYIVIEAVFSLKNGYESAIRQKMQDFNQRRREKQPLEYPSAGSTFKRPEGNFAGKLIMDAGLKGFRVGDMMISDKHCGFMINVGNGTAYDAVQLMNKVDIIVYEKFGVHLEPEVRLIGEFIEN
ncbi:UDP-N-acetylmuramate dehydrogenase [Anaeromicropila populeti]|uniref:UDP-N-acetylenolpyruvoylglucosamine reductase n=1 Tax=Anaeromicropila populeti TaxID=37658 RepID=A0A1I6JZU9_9FIRM|nr:UDP-N-acetylmuramate dehydrogenase [Anaeromicropila populeti]SFR84070.1 UDP-N-acetylmuramate dehydrogenase [Anaeromicropila populeti]